MRNEETPVSELGESALVERFAQRIGPARDGELWSGDDAAVVRPGSRELLFTTDVLVEGIDFDLAYASGNDIGWKAMAVNVSDIAAMGGRPGHALATLCLPGYTPVGLVDALLDGMLDAAAEWDVRVTGGDVSEAPQLVVGVALTGSADRAVTRSGASSGEALCVTGALGGAAGGLIALRGGRTGHDTLKRRHLRPAARVAEGMALGTAGATAMIDLSDGLARDLARLVAASGVGCDVDPTALPIEPGLEEVTDDARATAIVGGEDFELLCTLPQSVVDDAIRAVGELGSGLTRIGTTTDGEARIGGDPLSEWRDKGWEHLRNR